MRFVRFPLLLLTVCGAAFAVPSLAQEKVGVRGGDHEAYSRIVFEWADKPGYSLSKDGNRVLIRFAKAGALDLGGFETEKNIEGVKVLSSAAEPLQVGIDIPKGSRFRDFVVGNKLIVDVYDNSFDETAQAPDVPKKEPDIKVVPEEKKPEEKKAEPAKADFTRKPAENAKPVPVETVEAEKMTAPAFDPHVITIRHITSSGIAAFERFGRLWIALDSEEENVAPVLEGPQTAHLGDLKKLDGSDGGSVYYIDLPEGVKAYGQGGGLSWRVLLSDKDKEIPFAAPAVVNENGASALSWPLKNMRKKITFTDPMTGDEITAITASDSSQRAGAARRFINLDMLESDVGLAYAAKTDGVEPKILKDEVRIEKSGGLVVSSSLPSATVPTPKESAPTSEEKQVPPPAEEVHVDAAHDEGEKKEDAHKDDLALTEPPPAVEEKHDEETTHDADSEKLHEAEAAATSQEMAKAAEEKPKGNNIYNFPRWEMGGLHALEKNIHVLMVEAAGKPDEARPEDVVTMAKLLIANNRGPEALGMLRIALQKVPDLDEDKEFQALRGAALAISGKFDEAFADLTNENLNGYDDIKLWRAFVLGGLEDWKQAGEVLPSDLSAIQNYPKAIRAQMALMFAEIDLRNARVPDAQKNLDMLKPELKTLRPGYIAAWNYLVGELERQKGHADKATEYWDPLVKNGKDDLFRAKAGLSLTKLQIEQKKLSSEQAINRLEGLRYAWRGDELETLINYRLGQLYIENKDYLKGLTVLRNAATLTPELQVGQDVQTYMTKSFRDIFVKNEIAQVSPLDAIGIYEEFKDLFPPGAEADEYIEKLSERLVNADLLGRAASLLEYQVNNRLTGNKKVETAIRLAAIRLLDGNPQGALRALEVAQDTYNKVANGTLETVPANPALPDIVPQAGDDAVAPTPVAAKEKADPELERQIFLLKARALSMQKKPDEALAILNAMPPDTDVSRLRTDVAWFAGNWEEAAMSLNDLIVYEDISPKRPLTDYQRDLVLNRAIALNLSGNRVALANLRERYKTQMKDTAKGEMFEVVTRPRRPDMIGSREAIDSMISEIDLFKGFLDNYKTMTSKKAAVPAPATAKAPEKADAPATPEKKAETAH